MSRTINIGTIGVDAGMVWIGDPCYVLGSDASHGPKTWDEFCEKLKDSGFFESGKQHTHCEPLGSGIGFGVESGWGDGEYPVSIEIGDDGRVRSLTVSFDEPEDDEDEASDEADDIDACRSCFDEFTENELTDGYCENCVDDEDEGQRP